MLAVTPSGTTEAIFDKALPDTIATLGSYCIDRGWSVTNTTTNQVTCEIPMSMGQSILGQALMGNSYSTPPRQFVQFMAAQVGPASRVQVQNWMELQMAFGQVRRTDFTGPTFHNNAMGMLINAGGRFPPGTTFPNHAVMGVDVDNQPYQGKQGLRVKAIDPGSAAEHGGMQVGDVVFQIAGKRLKDANGYLDATAKAAATPTYEVLVARDGKPVKLSLERAFRPAATAPAAVTVATVPTVSSSPSTAGTSSIADELGKLAALRDKGILTDVEFQAQKAKLLGAQ
jgi:hypothetical protein